MTEWLQPLLELLKSFAFMRVVQPWEGAIHLRLGRFKRTLTPGWWLTLPVIDRVWDTSLLTEPCDVGPLPLRTKDGYELVASCVVSWEVSNVKLFLLGCADPKETLHDVASGTLAHAVLTTDWEGVPTEPFIAGVGLRVRKACRPYGIRVRSVRWTGLAQCRPVVLWSIGGAGHPASVLQAGKVGE